MGSEQQAAAIRSIRMGRCVDAVVYLKKSNIREAIGESGSTWLHLAAESRNERVARYLLENGSDVEAADEAGDTPLMLASRNYSAGMVRMLLGAGARALARNRSGECPARALFGRAELDAEVLQALLRRVSAERPQDARLLAGTLLECGCSLAQAVGLRRPGVTERMLDSGRFEGAECRAAALRRALALVDAGNVEALARRGVDLNAAPRSAIRGYFRASPQRHEPGHVRANLRLFRALLERGLPLSHGFGRYALRFLLQYGSRETVRQLGALRLELGPEPVRLYLLDYLVCNANFDPAEEIDCLRLGSLAGRRVSALLRAIRNGNAGSVRYLLQRGADPNARESSVATTALFYAFDRFGGSARLRPGLLRCVALLLEYGADVQHVCDRDQLTVFHLQPGHSAPVELALAHLAMLEALGQPIQDFTATAINSRPGFADYFAACRRVLADMRAAPIHDALSQFDLLTLGRSRIVALAHNRALVERLARSFLDYDESSHFYYHVVLRERAAKIVRMANLRDAAFEAVAQIPGLRQNAYLIREIANYYVHDEIQKIAA